MTEVREMRFPYKVTSSLKSSQANKWRGKRTCLHGGPKNTVFREFDELA